MSAILIRNVKTQTKEILQRRAMRSGRSLEGHLREVLERLANSEMDTPDESEPFGTWLVAATRPGHDLAKSLKRLRSAKARIPDLR